MPRPSCFLIAALKWYNLPSMWSPVKSVEKSSNKTAAVPTRGRNKQHWCYSSCQSSNQATSSTTHVTPRVLDRYRICTVESDFNTQTNPTTHPNTQTKQHRDWGNISFDVLYDISCEPLDSITTLVFPDIHARVTILCTYVFVGASRQWESSGQCVFPAYFVTFQTRNPYPRCNLVKRWKWMCTYAVKFRKNSVAPHTHWHHTTSKIVNYKRHLRRQLR